MDPAFREDQMKIQSRSGWLGVGFTFASIAVGIVPVLLLYEEHPDVAEWVCAVVVGSCMILLDIGYRLRKRASLLRARDGGSALHVLPEWMVGIILIAIGCAMAVT